MSSILRARRIKKNRVTRPYHVLSGLEAELRRNEITGAPLGEGSLLNRVILLRRVEASLGAYV